MTVNASLKALVTVDELVAYVNQETGNLDASQSDALQRLVNAVSEAMEGHCHTSLVKAAGTEYYDGGRERIILRRGPVDTGAEFAVSEDGTQLTPAADGSTRTSDGGTPDFWLDPEAGIIERNGTWLTGRRLIAVTYTAGVAVQKTEGGAVRTATPQALVAVDGPDDLREACLIICKAHTDLGPTNWGTQVVGDLAIRPQAWPLAARLILNRYMRYGG